MANNESTLKGYAVVQTGGKQYMVRENNVLEIELLDAKEGDKLELSPVLAISDGTKLTVGTPDIKGAKVSCTVVKQIRGPKVFAFMKKRRKGFRRKIGHRQNMLVIKVDKIA